MSCAYAEAHGANGSSRRRSMPALASVERNCSHGRSSQSECTCVYDTVQPGAHERARRASLPHSFSYKASAHAGASDGPRPSPAPCCCTAAAPAPPAPAASNSHPSFWTKIKSHSATRLSKAKHLKESVAHPEEPQYTFIP